MSESQIVKDAWAMGMELSVHGWVYHVASARLRDLGIGLKGEGIPVNSLHTPGTSEYTTSEANSDEEEEEDGDSDGYGSEELAQAIGKIRIDRAEAKRKATK